MTVHFPAGLPDWAGFPSPNLATLSAAKVAEEMHVASLLLALAGRKKKTSLVQIVLGSRVARLGQISLAQSGNPGCRQGCRRDARCISSSSACRKKRNGICQIGTDFCQIGTDFPAQSGNPGCSTLQPGLPDWTEKSVHLTIDPTWNCCFSWSCWIGLYFHIWILQMWSHWPFEYLSLSAKQEPQKTVAMHRKRQLNVVYLLFYKPLKVERHRMCHRMRCGLMVMLLTLMMGLVVTFDYLCGVYWTIHLMQGYLVSQV